MSRACSWLQLLTMQLKGATTADHTEVRTSMSTRWHDLFCYHTKPHVAQDSVSSVRDMLTLLPIAFSSSCSTIRLVCHHLRWSTVLARDTEILDQARQTRESRQSA